jgi:hypothetical protein
MVVAKTIILQCIFTQQKVQEKNRCSVVAKKYSPSSSSFSMGPSTRRLGTSKEWWRARGCVAPSGVTSQSSTAARRDGARSSTVGSIVMIPAACSNLIGAVLMEMEVGARRAFGVGFLGGGRGEQEQAANPYSHGRTYTRDAAVAASSGSGVPMH